MHCVVRGAAVPLYVAPARCALHDVFGRYAGKLTMGGGAVIVPCLGMLSALSPSSSLA